MTLSVGEIKTKYEEASAKVSELNRSLAFAGIAIIWVFKTGDPANGESVQLTKLQLISLTLFAFLLISDFLHYIARTVTLGYLNSYFWKEHGDLSAKVKWKRRYNWHNYFFYIKIILGLLGYGFLVWELVSKITIG